MNHKTTPPAIFNSWAETISFDKSWFCAAKVETGPREKEGKKREWVTELTIENATNKSSMPGVRVTNSLIIRRPTAEIEERIW